MAVPLPAGTRAKDLTVVIQRRKLKVRCKVMHISGPEAERHRSRSSLLLNPSWRANSSTTSRWTTLRGQYVSNRVAIQCSQEADGIEDGVLTIELEKLSYVAVH